jgi:hypothetical protein
MTIAYLMKNTVTAAQLQYPAVRHAKPSMEIPA